MLRKKRTTRPKSPPIVNPDALSQASLVDMPTLPETSKQSSSDLPGSYQVPPLAQDRNSDPINGSSQKGGEPSQTKKRVIDADAASSEPVAKRLRSSSSSINVESIEQTVPTRRSRAVNKSKSKPPKPSGSKKILYSAETHLDTSPPQQTPGPSKPTILHNTFPVQEQQAGGSLIQAFPGPARTDDVSIVPLNQTPIAGPSQPLSSAKHDSQTKKGKVKEQEQEQEEKRLARFKPKCPGNILDRVERVTQQRFFMVDREKIDNELKEKFSVLGSTGNVYTVTIEQIPSCDCPDATKGNHCKHILFVFLKVLHVPRESHCWYQKALLTSELEEIFANAPKAPNAVLQATASVTAAYHRATGKSTATEPEPGLTSRRIPGPDDDCPICYETMYNESLDKLKFCETCGNGLHAECFTQWSRSTTARGQQLTCVWCRASWAQPGASGTSEVRMSRDGYMNLAEMAGMSTKRDTSTYHGWRRYYD